MRACERLPVWMADPLVRFIVGLLTNGRIDIRRMNSETGATSSGQKLAECCG